MMVLWQAATSINSASTRQHKSLTVVCSTCMHPALEHCDEHISVDGNITFDMHAKRQAVARQIVIHAGQNGQLLHMAGMHAYVQLGIVCSRVLMMY